MDQQQPAWFQRISEMPVLGRLAVGLGPWGFGGCTALAVVAACVGTTLILGGLSIFGGALLDAPFASGLAFGSDPEIMTVTPTHSATASATPSQFPAENPTNSPEPSDDECRAALEDDEGDTVNGDSGEPYNEPAADATGITSYCQDGKLGFDVMLASPDVVSLDMYSFAVRLMLFGPDGAELYRFLFQHHGGETTTSAVESDTEESLDAEPDINLLQANGEAKAQFIFPRSLFPRNRGLGAAARIFYMATSDGVFVTDETETLRLPDF